MAEKRLNRLRAAAGLVPLIEGGLRDGKISDERAGQMAQFCAWALAGEAEAAGSGEESRKLAAEVEAGLRRLGAGALPEG